MSLSKYKMKSLKDKHNEEKKEGVVEKVKKAIKK